MQSSVLLLLNTQHPPLTEAWRQMEMTTPLTTAAALTTARTCPGFQQTQPPFGLSRLIVQWLPPAEALGVEEFPQDIQPRQELSSPWR